MQLIIQSVEVTTTEALTKFVKNKIGKLSHTYDKIQAAEVFLKIEASNVANDKICEIKLAVCGNDLYVKKQSQTFETAITMVVDELHAEINKVKLLPQL